jgi:hypothetical protein
MRRHGVLLVFGAPCQLRLLQGQEQEHGRDHSINEHQAKHSVDYFAFGFASAIAGSRRAWCDD